MAAGCREQSIEKAKELILERLYSVNHEQTAATTLRGRTEALGVVRGALEQSIHRAFSSSLIIQGPSGSGKSWLINEVLKGLNSDPKCKDLFLVVRLNGLVHMDDHQALLEIVTQLGLEVEPGKMIQMSFVNALKLLMETLGQGHRGQKTVVFVIEAFEAFVSHKNQTLLYNLLDLAQTDRTPIAVVGLTTLMNTTDRLEKRIRSRASFQVVCLDIDFSFEEYLGICKSLLSLPSNFADKAFLWKWKAHLEDFVKDSGVLGSLRDMYNISANLHWLRLSLAMAVSRSHLLVEPGELRESIKHLTGGYSVSPVLTGLSILEMTLLVAVHHLITLSQHDHFNFEMVYTEYKRFIQRSQSAQFCDKKIVLKAFENLVQLELVHPVSGISRAHSTTGGGRRTTKEHKMMASGVAAQELKDAIRNFPNCPTDLSRWALSHSMQS